MPDDELELDNTILWELQDDDEFLCMNIDCAYSTHDKSELKACIECGRVYCPEHLAEIGSEYYCSDCARCKTCHSEAIYYCELCGNLGCSEHVFELSDLDSGTGYSGVELVCLDCRRQRT